jgi:hypothetical protein
VCSVTLELSEMDVEEVTEALQSEQRQLLDELAHADSRAYRAMLRGKAERVERLLLRFEQAAQEGRTRSQEPALHADPTTH